MPLNVDTEALESRLLLAGEPYAVAQAVLTIVRHIARGGNLTGVARSALSYALSVRPRELRADATTRTPEVF